METSVCIKTRRSVRKFLPKPVEEEKILELLEAARWAPSAGNTNETRFVIVKNLETRKKIAEACLGQYWMTMAPVYIIVLSKYEKMERLYGTRGINLYMPVGAGASIQNLLLRANDLGLGACWVGAFDDFLVSQAIKATEEAKPIAIIPVGYPHTVPKPTPRPDLNEIVYFEKYLQKTK